MIFFSDRKNRLIGKCDACGATVEGYEGSSDRCDLTCVIFQDHGWMQRIEGKRWKHYCPECKAEYYRQKREKYFKEG